MNILLVEDEEKVAHFIKRGLEEEGYSVDVVDNGREGLSKIRSFSYDLVLLDIMIPEIDGFEVLKRMRAEYIDTPVLILTAKDSKEDVVKGLELGSDDYLTKPFSFEELLARIKALVRRTKKVSPPLLRCGPLTLNPITRKLYTEEKEVDLTEKEFLIMEFLMKNKGKAVTRKEIGEYVWQNELESSNIVDVYINFLRKKIEHLLPEKKCIRTVRGVGYIFVEQ